MSHLSSSLVFILSYLNCRCVYLVYVHMSVRCPQQPVEGIRASYRPLEAAWWYGSWEPSSDSLHKHLHALNHWTISPVPGLKILLILSLLPRGWGYHSFISACIVINYWINVDPWLLHLLLQLVIEVLCWNCSKNIGKEVCANQTAFPKTN